MSNIALRTTAIRRIASTSLGAGLVLLALGAAPALAAPDPSFTVAPDPPVSGASAVYTSTSTADAGFAIAKVEWDFNDDGTYDVTDEAAPWTAAHTYATAGAKTFSMRVTDNNALLPMVAEEAQTITVAQANRAPTSAFAFSPVSPLIGDDVLFASDASDPDGDTLAYLWDFGDGTPDSTARNPIHKFQSAGPKSVTLKVTDPDGVSHTLARQIVVRGILVPGNNLPVVRFVFSPRSPRVGDSVEFVSSTTDPEGDLREQAWDLDGDEEFDDARGDEVVYSFATPGQKIVRQRATDGAGGSAIAERTLTVTPVPKAKAGFLAPAPVIRFIGEIHPNGARIKVLIVRAPKGSLVTVKCRGKGCPVSRRRKRVKQSSVRFKSFERFLRAGVKLEIFIRKPNTIGAYTRYTIRAGKFPARTDRCLPVGKDKPAKSCR